MKKLILLIPLIFLVACSSTIYVCYDGTIEEMQRDCPTMPAPTLTKVQAERSVDNFATAYARARDAQFSRVNTYFDQGDFYSEILFTQRDSTNVSRVKVEIGGRTGSVNCIEGCNYLE